MRVCVCVCVCVCMCVCVCVVNAVCAVCVCVCVNVCAYVCCVFVCVYVCVVLGIGCEMCVLLCSACRVCSFIFTLSHSHIEQSCNVCPRGLTLQYTHTWVMTVQHHTQLMHTCGCGVCVSERAADREVSVCVCVCVCVCVSVSEEIVTAINSGDILFAVSQNPDLQATIPVLLASLYVTTGRVPQKPTTSAGVYMTGPNIVDSSNVPSPSFEKCADRGFPKTSCVNRKSIHIGAVFDVSSKSSQWDAIFAAAEQATKDMGTSLDIQTFSPNNGEDESSVHSRMADTIRTICDNNADGLFVSIPSSVVADAVAYCQTLGIPVVAIDTDSEYINNIDIQYNVGPIES